MTSKISSNIKTFDRVLAFIIESVHPLFMLIGWCIFINLDERTIDNYFLVFTFPLFVIILFIDKFWLPHKTGYTIFSWVLGYKIKSKSGFSVSYWQLLKRVAAIVAFEILITPIFSFLTMVIRSDRRSIHEIISNTYCEYESNRLQAYSSYSIILFSAITTILIVINVVTFESYWTFVVPKIEYEKREGWPTAILNDRNTIKKYFGSDSTAIDSLIPRKIGSIQNDTVGLIKRKMEWPYNLIFPNLSQSEAVYLTYCEYNQNRPMQFPILNPFESIKRFGSLYVAYVAKVNCSNCIQKIVFCNGRYQSLLIAEFNTNRGSKVVILK